MHTPIIKASMQCIREEAMHGHKNGGGWVLAATKLWAPCASPMQVLGLSVLACGYRSLQVSRHVSSNEIS